MATGVVNSMRASECTGRDVRLFREENLAEHRLMRYSST
jgi:hypothetical protein